jgi:hypothetical protein
VASSKFVVFFPLHAGERCYTGFALSSSVVLRGPSGARLI